MAGIRAMAVGAMVLSGLTVAGGAAMYGMCDSAACDKSAQAATATTEAAPTVAAAASTATALTDGEDAGCDKPCPMSAQKAALAANVVAQPGAVLGDTTPCPVNGEIFTITADSPTKTIDGVDYFVCCDACTGEAHNDGAAALDL